MSLRPKTLDEARARQRAANERRRARHADKQRKTNARPVSNPVPPAPPPPSPAGDASPGAMSPGVRTVSVAPREVGPPIDKRGAVLLPTLRRWVDAQPCEFPESPAHPGKLHAGGDHHHEPTTGSNGVQLDTLMAACCRRAHDLCHVSSANGGWTEEQRQAAAHRTWTRFWRLASAEDKRAVARELLAAVE